MVNDYFQNPAIAGSRPYVDAISANRLQWIGITDAPRTYALSASGEFVPARHLSRGNTRVRWITRLNGEELGADPRWAVFAVVSRDKQHAVAAGRADRAVSFTLANNTLFTCLHTDSVVAVAPGGKTTTREFFWFLDGTLDDLRARVQRDLRRTD